MSEQRNEASSTTTAVTETLQTAVDEIAALRLMSYTGGQADLGENEINRLCNTLMDLAILLSRTTGQPLPEPEVIL